MAAPYDAPVVCPTLIGRAAHVASLAGLARDAFAGRGRLALIAGEPGIGKSRLLAELQARTSADSANAPLILIGRCYAQDTTLPYAPVRDLLRGFVGSQQPDEVAAAIRDDPAAFMALLPDLAPLVPGDAAQPNGADIEKARLIRAIVGALSTLASRRPLLLIVEDLHWSDEGSLDLLLALARRAPALPIFLLATYRDGEIRRALGDFLAATDREHLATEFPLARLALDETDAMLRAIFGLDRSPRADFVHALYRLTEGNPFFVEEVVKSLIAAGDIFYADGAWNRKPLEELRIPRSVLLAVQRRLDDLSDNARQLLSLAAVAGRQFDFALLEVLTDHDERTLVRLIKELIAAQLVVEEEEDHFGFRHALTRQAVYSDLLARERRALHRSVAEALERLHADQLDAWLTDLTHHWAAAGVWERVLGVAPRAGRQAQALHVPHAAIEQYTVALDAAQRLDQSPPRDILRARGQVYETLGDFDAALADYSQVLALAEAAGDRAAELEALGDLGWLWTGHDFLRARDYLERVLDLCRALDQPELLARTLNRVGNLYTNSERLRDGLRLHDEALAIYRALGDRRGQAGTLELLGLTSYMGGDVFASVGYYDGAIALFRALDDQRGLATVLIPAMLCCSHTLFSALATPATTPEGFRKGEEALAIARRIGWRAGEANALAFLSYVLGPQGEFARGWAAAAEGLAVGRQIDHRTWLSSAQLGLGIVAANLLAYGTAREMYEQALVVMREMRSDFMVRVVSGLLAQVQIGAGDLVGAATTLDAVLTDATPMRSYGESLVWAARIELLLAHGAAADALAIVERVIAAGANADERNPAAVVPFLWHQRGRALATLGQRDSALTALRAAETRAREQGLRPLLWRIQVSVGTILRAAGRRDEAIAILAAAQALVDELAINAPDEAMREEFLRQAATFFPRPTPTTPRRAAKQSFGGLTTREREVAALIARGKSNRAIADDLYVVERTIEKHVENILGKLAFTSRAQIAAWAVEKGLNARERG
ncbi:MAG: AAA family ATPase [Thermomicrobiales bacterium]